MLPAPGCVDPARGPSFGRFRDVTEASGVAFAFASPTFQGAGLAVADLDGDGLPELVAARRDGGLAMWRNLGGLAFAPALDAGLDPALGANAIAVADLDNDGDRELIVGAADGFRVLDNLGDGRFREAAAFTDVLGIEHVLPVDLDGDGLLDLYVGNYDFQDPFGAFNGVYLNHGGLELAFATTAGAGLTWSTTAFDFDDDGDQDLYVANDTLEPDFGDIELPGDPPAPHDLLLRNDGPGPDGVPVLTNIADERGLAQPKSSMGGVLADLDLDGRLDLYVPDFGTNKLYVRTPDGQLVDRAPALGLDQAMRDSERCDPTAHQTECLLLSWSAVVADFDLDGRDEVLIGNGFVLEDDHPPPQLFARGADGDDPAFHELTPDLPCTSLRSQIATDLDGDGDQDLVVEPLNGPLAIFENVGTPDPERWLRVALRGRASNRDGVGAQVVLHLASGATQLRAIGGGGMIHGAGPAEAVFGLGDDAVDRVEVRWPDGAVTELPRPATGPSMLVDEGP